jgi:hypothetical protein
MKSQTTRSFWQHYWALPPEIRQRARQAYKLWREDVEPTAKPFLQTPCKESQRLFTASAAIAVSGIQQRLDY